MRRIVLTIITLVILSCGATAQDVNIPDANFKTYLVLNTSINTNMDSEIQMSEAHAFTGEIDCGYLSISDLTGIEAFTALTELRCYGNTIAALDLSQNIALTILHCGFNPYLTSLNISQSTDLTLLNTDYNTSLNTLHLSQGTALTTLSLKENGLNTLDVSQNTALEYLYCDANYLSSLDLSQNTALIALVCYNNFLLTELNLKNISPSILTNLSAYNNPNLTCIDVDDVAAAESAWTGIDAQTSFSLNCSPIVNIPDVNFKAFLVGNNSINTNSDSEIQVSEAEAFTGTIDCQAQSISDLTGIEAFTALTELNINSNNLTILDASQNTALTLLHCGYNNLSSVNVSQNTALTDFNTSSNTSLSTLDVSQNTALTRLVVGKNNLTTLDISQNPALDYLQCQENSLSSLDVSQNPALEFLYCVNNSLNALDLSQNTALTILNVSGNNLSTLDISQNTALIDVHVAYNSLTSLNLNQNMALTELSVYSNNLSTLDVSQNSSLVVLSCSINNLSTLDVSQNIALMEFSCEDNQIDALDVSQNTALVEFNCSSNNLTVLNMKNISTIQLDDFAAESNPNLTCIDVDDIAAATAAWTDIDVQTSFSENCAVAVTSITVQGQAGASTISTLGGTLQMGATVLPMNATDGTYTWSVINLTGSADIDANGLLTAITDGTVKVGVTANDGSGVTGSVNITISNQSSSIGELSTIPNISIYPNPTNAEINIDAEGNIEAITIMDIMGKTVKTIVEPSHTIDVSDLTKGIYFLQIQIDETLVSRKIIKE